MMQKEIDGRSPRGKSCVSSLRAALELYNKTEAKYRREHGMPPRSNQPSQSKPLPAAELIAKIEKQYNEARAVLDQYKQGNSSAASKGQSVC